MTTLIQFSYLAAAFLFIFGLKRMSSPKTARSGIVWAGAGMVVATLVTFLDPHIMEAGIGRILLIALAVTIGTVVAWRWGKAVAMTDMPQMVAIYNGMGGGAAGTIAAIELIKMSEGTGAHHDTITVALAVIGGLIGAVSMTGSVVAWAKLDGRMNKAPRIPGGHRTNFVMLGVAAITGLMIISSNEPSGFVLFLFFFSALAFGVMMTLPIGGADMPVIISLFNALTGLAVSFEGYVLQNPAMIIAGMVVGAAGTVLTLLMAKAMNRSISNVLFSGLGASDSDADAEGPEGEMKEISPADAAIAMCYGQKVIIVPGYGMAVAQAQHKLWEFVQLLQSKDVEVSFAIHPVAGRMPGHMNVLLAEAGVPYDIIFDLEEINDEFAKADAVIVIGANDVVNPAARTNKSSPIYGMPIMNADHAQQVYVIKRGQGTGFSGIQNELFFGENTRMVYGDAQKVCAQFVAGAKEMT
jgi:NAD(P) transhydrogenase subunit beta